MAPTKHAPRKVAKPIPIISSDTRIRKSQPYRLSSNVRLRKNGLLNTTISAKSMLMAIAIRNSLESPLLRLPAEIRILIWEYALGGNYIVIKPSSTECNPSKRPKQTHVSWPVHTPPGPLGQDPGHSFPSFVPNIMKPLIKPWVSFFTAKPIRPAFQLHRVCRQMYVETVLLPYTSNTFVFGNGTTAEQSMAIMKDWNTRLLPAQKSAITSIRPTSKYLLEYYWYRRVDFQKRFPGIKNIDISEVSPGYADMIKTYIREREPELTVEWNPIGDA